MPRQHLRRTRPRTQEKQDLEDDLDFLQSSPPPKKVRRSEYSKNKSKRDKLLEEIKKKRAGGAGAGTLSSDSELEVVEPDSEDESEEDEEAELKGIEDEGEGEDDRQEDTAKYSASLHTTAADVFEEQEGDSDFITSDDDDTIGEPAGLPVEFTSTASAKPKELFPHIIEWMVRKKMDPSFDLAQDIHRLAFDKLDAQPRGLVNSKFMVCIFQLHIPGPRSRGVSLLESHC